MEAAIRWSPHEHGGDSRFLLLDIFNSSLSLHQLVSINKSKVESKEIATYSKLPSFAAFDWSKTTPSVISLGHVSGSASLIRLNLGSQTSEIIATYKARQQRRCNSTALSTQNWLAVALDKTRADLCLNIYDAASTSPDPVRRLCPAELISSVRFFANSPYEVLAGAQRSFIRLYDLRDGFAGGPGNLQITSRSVNNITIDPLDENYFAAGGSTDDPSVTVWDKRWLTQGAGSEAGAVFEFRPAVSGVQRTSIWSLRYSGSRRGRLALCSSAGELKAIDMAGNQNHNQNSAQTNTQGGSPWTINQYVRETRTLEHPTIDQRQVTHAVDRLIAFDWTSALDGARDQEILVLRASRTVSAFSMKAAAAASITSRNTLGIVAARMTQVEQTQTCPKQYPEDAASLDCNTPSDMQSTVQLLLNSTATQHIRCKQGYLFDCSKNAAIVADSWQLERLWETISQLRTMAKNDKMIYDSIDFSYVGIRGLWDETAGGTQDRKVSISSTRPTDAITGLAEKLELPLFEGERTDYPEHRQLCLAVCGWKFQVEDLELECQGLIEKGAYYQAIAQAVLHGSKHLALNILRTLIREKTIPNIGLGALIAATDLNDEQREMTLWMAADTDDPALKALLTYFSCGDWRDVMKTSYLNLGYRLALGLKYLNDTELNGFIQSETARAIKNGDPEGVLLTGLTEQAMDLFQAYIIRTNDLQTAVLATAFTNPRYIEDERWSMWKETYFMQMQAWRAFAERARFVIEHNHLAKIRDGTTLVESKNLQPKLRCVHCQNSITRGEHRPKSTSPVTNAGEICFSCGRSLPRCSVCTLWLGTPDVRRAKPAVSRSKQSSGSELLDKMLVFCTKCDHGSHAHHAREWFTQHNVCPVPSCTCSCNDQPSADGISIADLWCSM